MTNLSEIQYYEDEIDRWAAAREFELRQRRYEIARKGVIEIFANTAKAARQFSEALCGLDGAGKALGRAEVSRGHGRPREAATIPSEEVRAP